MAAGCGIGALLHVVCVPVLMFLASLLDDMTGSLDVLLPLLLWGVVQLVYMVPAFFVLHSRGRREQARGVLLCAAASFLLWGARSGIFLVG